MIKQADDVPFSRRFLLWLLAPPAFVSVPIAALFLAQVTDASGYEWLQLAIVGAFVYGAGSAFLIMQLLPLLRRIEESGPSEDLSETLSDTLRRTSLSMAGICVGGGLLFAIVASWAIGDGAAQFSQYFVAALIATAPSLCWAYASAKAMLVRESMKRRSVHYLGSELPLGRKMAIVFVGLFLIAAAAIVQLISARVSTTLEHLAISSSADLFDRTNEKAQALAHLDPVSLATLAETLPEGYSVAAITRDGKVVNAARRENIDLTDNEIGHIRKIRNGNTSRFAGTHVGQFRTVADGSIFVFLVPWAPYQNVPYEIAFYTFVIALITTLFFIAATFFLSHDIGGPLKQLRKMAGEMADGQFDSDLSIFSDDEIGALATSFSNTRSNLRSLVSRIGGRGSSITEGVRVITSGTENLLVRAHEQTTLTTSSSAAVANVRGGAESVLGAAETVTELSQDASSRSTELQASAEEVARSMDYLFQSVEKTSSSVTEMDAAAREMSNRTEVLANIGEEVLSFVTQMDATIDGLRKTAMKTADISRQVREDAGGGGDAVQKTVEGIQVARDATVRTSKVIDELQRSIGQISQILLVIEEVTERTNLLSLNAAIIAAQAGEQGAGFTVVADEIRELADRTRGSTKEIGGIIKNIQRTSREAVGAMHEGVEQVSQNVALARNAATSLQKIVSSAAESYEMANKISNALGEQTEASRHLHQVTSKMSDHIAEINRSTREQARGTMLLAEEAERVREIALQVKNSTHQQSTSASGITSAMEQISTDVRTIRDLLQKQLAETDRIASASTAMLTIAQTNDRIAQDFNITLQSLIRSGQDFENEVSRFKFSH